MTGMVFYYNKAGSDTRYYLLDDAAVKAKIDGVANQGKVQHLPRMRT